MKNLKIYLAIITFFAISLIITSCTKDDVDNTKPTITVGEPADDDTLHVGDEIHFECEFEDDIELKSYKIDIHSDDDGHTHTKSVGEEGHAWTYLKTWEFEAGQKNAHIHHHEIVIPETVDGEPILHGNYHFGIYCTDVAGNETSVFVDIVIEDEHATKTE